MADDAPVPETLSLLEACRSGDLPAARLLISSEAADLAYQDEQGQTPLMLAAGQGLLDIATTLLDRGAPWNAVDRQGLCAGDYAAAAGHAEVFEAMVDAGCRAELLLAALERKTGMSSDPHDSYLRQTLHYQTTAAGQEQLIDAESRAVMMSWEGALMKAHAAAICSRGGSILNVGFGLGLIDEAIQSHRPQSHTIVEAHPDVLARMRTTGWGSRPGVSIIAGRWQDVLPDLDQYDGIFFDTYSEYYEDLRQFHAALPKILRQDGIYSFFNGLAADNETFHAVYCKIVAGELSSLGLQTQFIALPVPAAQPEVWQGIGNRYWQLDTYQLPVCEWSDSAGSEHVTVEQ